MLTLSMVKIAQFDLNVSTVSAQDDFTGWAWLGEFIFSPKIVVGWFRYCSCQNIQEYIVSHTYDVKYRSQQSISSSSQGY
jgi:hypothetical protein